VDPEGGGDSPSDLSGNPLVDLVDPPLGLLVDLTSDEPLTGPVILPLGRNLKSPPSISIDKVHRVMKTYAGEGLLFFDSGLLPGETEGGLLWMENRKGSMVGKTSSRWCTNFAGGGAVKFVVPWLAGRRL